MQLDRAVHHAFLLYADLISRACSVDQAHGMLRRFAPSRDNPKLYAIDYEAVFIGTVREALLSVDPDVVFVDSSPSKGVLSLAPYVKRCASYAHYKPHHPCP